MRIFFDDVELNPNFVCGLSIQGDLYASGFKLGATLCRVITLDVDKTVITEHPIDVEIYDDELSEKLFTLIVDEVSDKNDHYYEYTLVDKMILTNEVYDWTILEDRSVNSILRYICMNVLECPVPIVSYGGTFTAQFTGYITMRTFLSYVAELNGAYAWIDGNGHLMFVPLKTQTPKLLDLNTCADIKIGTKHKITNVLLDIASAAVLYPAERGDGDILYLNTNNILFGDTDEHSIRDEVIHIYETIKNFEFVNFKTTNCLLADGVHAGDLIQFNLNGTNYITIANSNWEYNAGWSGGYELDVSIEKIEQEDNSAILTEIKNLEVKVDRNNNTITQRVGAIETNITGLSDSITDVFTQTNNQIADINNKVYEYSQSVSEIQQKSDEIEFRVQSVESQASESDSRVERLETAVNIQADGVRISQGDADNYTKFGDNGMEIYVGGKKVAYARSDAFYAIDYELNGWHLETTNNNNTFNFIRREYNND